MIATCGWLKRNILLFKQQPWCLSLSLHPSLCMGVCAYDLHIYKIIFRMKNWSCNYVEITFEFWAQNRCQHYYYSKINQINETIKLDDYYLIWSSSLFTCYVCNTFPFTIPFQSCIFVHKFHHSQHQPQINRSNIISTWNTNCNNLNFDNILPWNEVLLLLISDCFTGKSVI